jgi:hypothetical protein
MGDAIGSTACVTASYLEAKSEEAGEPVGAPLPIGETTSCHGSITPFDRVHDMIGNVGEWVDATGVDQTTAIALFAQRGPPITWTGQTEPVSCAWSLPQYLNKSMISPMSGIRCCLD